MWRFRRPARVARDRSAQDEDQRKAREFVASLRLPPARTVRDLIPYIQQHTGRPIKLVPVTDETSLPRTSDGSLPCGTWMAIGDTDYLFYDATTSLAHQDLIIGHELAHILRAYLDLIAGLITGDRRQDLDCLDPDGLENVGDLGGLLPDMTPTMIRMLRARTRYSKPEEADAETIGSLLQEHVHSSRAVPDRDDPITRTLLRRPR
ncbi:hypothetical protein [Streptomyces sp. NPDC088915]|uniref:hypothetical protein n=1 Tax=Streptomyces sp. NPDC088915 TaxID=3365912 RepID=UPI003805323B